MSTAGNRYFSFVGGSSGPWKVEQVRCLTGAPIRAAERVSITTHQTPAPAADAPDANAWVFTGVTSNDRYVERAEKTELAQRQEGLGRDAAVHGALIPIRKNAGWWALAQDERRAIFERDSRHISIGMQYLPATARRLHHCRDLGPDQPFDFLTWFEFEPQHAAAFESLLSRLRASAEWQFVDRELEIRLRREPV